MKPASLSSYAELREKIQETPILGQEKVEEAKVLTYWETGSLIKA